MTHLATLGWPPNVELLASTYTAISCAIGQQRAAIDTLRQAQARRPEYQSLNEHLELLAIATDDIDLALESNLLRADTSEVLEKRALHLFRHKRLPQMLDIVDVLAQRTDARPLLGLAAGRAAAKSLGRIADADRYKSKLAEIDDGEFLFFSDATFLSISKDGADPRHVLREGLRQHPDSILLAGNLLSNLRETLASEAREIPPLARLMRKRQELGLRDWEHVVRAHLTLGEGAEAEREATQAIAQFGRRSDFVELLAVACEMQGRTGDAIRFIDEAVASGSNNRAVFRNLFSLSIRLGRMDAALSALDRLLATGPEKDERLEWLRNKALILQELGRISEAYDVAQLIGAEVDRNSEFEEGLYVNLMMAISIRHNAMPEPARGEFWGRTNTFTERWPKSKFFQSATLDEAGQVSIGQIHDILDSIRGGDSRARLQEMQKREQQLKDDQIGMPFVLRPQFVFHYLQDPFEVWDVMMQSRREDRQFHLVIRQDDHGPIGSRDLRDMPLLDLTALLVLSAIDAFPLLFHVFGRVAIPRSIVGFVSQQAHSAFSGRSSTVAKKLLCTIDEYGDRIDQPSANVEGEGSRSGFLLFDFEDLAATGKWLVFCDDVVSWNYIFQKTPGLRRIDSVALLETADADGIVSPVEVAHMLSRLNGWNVGINIKNRFLIAALEGALPATGPRFSISQRIDAFQRHEPFASLARAIWYPQKSMDVLIYHMGRLIADMIDQREESDLDSVAAVWSFWANRVELMRANGRITGLPLVMSLVNALGLLPIESASKAIATFLSVVEAVSNANRMSNADEDRMIEMLGKSLALISDKQPADAAQIRAKIERVFPPGTHHGDVFANGFLAQVNSSNSK